ncbi:MAG: S8 family serine peptidase, partial [Micromonosporaceae bacterium]|nr:S8 family serine peptidase [Micromonosporaceae bacterium]
SVSGKYEKSESAVIRAALPDLRGTGKAGGVTKISLDRKVLATPLDAASPPGAAGATGAANAANAAGAAGNLAQIGAFAADTADLTGTGIRVAVLDTGIDLDHPDLAGQVVESADFTGSGSVADSFGHGTHVAATIAGTGAASAGRYRGVAPGARLVIGRVLDASGGGTESAVIAGMEWAAPRASVVNLSLGAPAASEGEDPLVSAVETLTERYGTLFVASAGNSGPQDVSVESPGIAPSALTVGAVDASGTIASFSSRGPVPGTGAVKPEIVAPGVDIVSARAAGTSMGRVIDGRYTAAGGTSMAAPHVAGAAALLKQRWPGWRAEQLKPALVGSADPASGGDVHVVGNGRVNVARALSGPHPAEATINAGTLAFPQSGIATATMRWTNAGGDPTTLRLSVTATDRNGVALPTGAVGLSASSVGLSAGGSGGATLRIDQEALAERPGYVTAVVTASAGRHEVRTPVSLFVEPPSSTLTVRATPIPGTSEDHLYSSVTIVNLDDPVVYTAAYEEVPPEGATFRVPNGRYSVTGTVNDYDFEADIWRTALAGDPDVTVAADASVTLDGAAARPFDVTVEGVGTRRLATVLGFTQTARRGQSWSNFAGWWSGMGGGTDGALVVPMELVGIGTFTADRYASLGAPEEPSPYLYDLYYTGRSFTGEPHVVTRAEQATLAQVTHRFSRLDIDGSVTGHKRYGLNVAGDLFGENATDAVGATRVDYLTPGVWLDEAFYSGIQEYPTVTQEPQRTVAAGAREEKSWVRQPLHTDWLDAVESPSTCKPETVTRTVGNLSVQLAQLVDAHNRFDCLYEDVPNRRLALYRNGVKIGEATEPYGNFTIPRRESVYRLTYDLDFGVPQAVASAVSTAWTFRSSGADTSVPLLSLDYDLPLDAANHPMSGIATMTVHQMGHVVPRLRSAEVFTSVDDGVTWTAAKVQLHGNRLTAQLPTVTTGAVSLRVRAVANQGSEIEQTMIRAYRAA